MLSFAAICPHPPIIIPEIGGVETIKVKATIKAMEKLADDFRRSKISSAVVVSPHGPVDWHYMNLNVSKKIHGSFFNFGYDAEMKFENDTEIANAIYESAKKSGIPINKYSEPHLDHGVLVPLYFLSKNVSNLKIVPTVYSFLDYEAHYEFGKAIHEAISTIDENIALIASGDLSHRLIPDAPAGYSPRGKEFDKLLIELLEQGNDEGVLTLNPDLIEDAGECGLRSIIILLGAISSIKNKFEEISYEGPFGVGYLVGKYNII